MRPCLIVVRLSCLVVVLTCADADDVSRFVAAAAAAAAAAAVAVLSW